MSKNQGEIINRTREQLERPSDGQAHFSDTPSEVAGLEVADWYKYTDFDSALTIAFESTGGLPELEKIPIGLRPWLTPYGLVLVDDLVRARNERVAKFATGETLHPDAALEVERAKKAPIVVANYAPRDKEHAENNGSNFYLAVTDSGLEIVVTPLQSLSALEARNRIVTLYEIPNEDHPEYDGEHEQFRSARVVRSRRNPEHLVPVFEYADQAELIAAKEAGTHPQIVPADERGGHIAFVDKFGNVKTEFADIRKLRTQKLGKAVTLIVTNLGEKYEIEAEVVSDLRSAPLGTFAIYANCSDHIDEGSTVGFAELAVRVDGNPSTSRETAYRQLAQLIPDLDPATAEIELVA